MITAEENLDMILLVIRNGVQFLRIVNILRRYVAFPASFVPSLHPDYNSPTLQ